MDVIAEYNGRRADFLNPASQPARQTSKVGGKIPLSFMPIAPAKIKYKGHNPKGEGGVGEDCKALNATLTRSLVATKWEKNQTSKTQRDQAKSKANAYAKASQTQRQVKSKGKSKAKASQKQRQVKSKGKSKAKAKSKG
ncbi:hypothetical protein POVCU2_0033200 [Plasmodium ovale curtisi]|uniref:Uncharacterized protein n=1 Tax=Plasmodium ovale curtisi TaxID=864141 RepID=A0A1A8W3M7_PLAOA|nr:hypothetical protein POVCU2_0033200 [Plasmodium ovale curtisi]